MLTFVGYDSAKQAFFAIVFAVLATVSLLGCSSSPDDLAIARWELEGPASATLDLPTHLDAYLTSRPATYTLSANVTLPEDLREGELTFAIPLLPSLASLRVNGVPAIPLDDVLSDRYRSRGPLAWHVPHLPSASRTLRLELTVENTWAQSGWIDSVPHLSAGAHGDPWYVFIRSWNDFAAICA